MTSYKLTYFDFDGGRGEPVRIALHAAGIEFEDERWAFPVFQERRGEVRFNALPVLEIDGIAVTQSNAQCRYVGKLAGLYPKDDLQALYCDEVMGAVEDHRYTERTRGKFLAIAAVTGDGQAHRRGPKSLLYRPLVNVGKPRSHPGRSR
jgi:glutathione S-transferase